MGIEDFISIRRWNRLWPRIKAFISNMISETIAPEGAKEVISVLTYSANTPASPSADDYYINSVLNKLYKYVDSAWVEQTASTDCVYITEDTAKVYVYQNNQFSEVAGGVVDGIIYIRFLSSLDSYLTPGVYKVVYLGELHTLYVTREATGPGGRFWYYTQTLLSFSTKREREKTPLDDSWENWYVTELVKYDRENSVSSSNKIACFTSTTGIKNSNVSIGSIATTTDLSAKADKVTSATSGNFAGLDTNGNLTDSGKKASDFAAANHNHDGVYQPAGSYAPASHTHAQSEVTNLVTDLAAKASKMVVETITDNEYIYNDQVEPATGIISILPNTLYKFPSRSSNLGISLAAGEQNKVSEYHLIIETGSSSAPTIEFLDTLSWNGTPPTPDVNKTYEFSILEGIITFIEI